MKDELRETYSLETGDYKIYVTYEKVYVKLHSKIIISVDKPIEDYQKQIIDKIEKYNAKILKGE